MTFDHLYIGRSQAGIGQRRTYQRGLGRSVGSRQRTGTPIVIDRAAAYDGSHAVAVAQGIRQAFQDDEAHALAPDIAIGAGIESTASVTGTKRSEEHTSELQSLM